MTNLPLNLMNSREGWGEEEEEAFIPDPRNDWTMQPKDKDGSDQQIVVTFGQPHQFRLTG